MKIVILGAGPAGTKAAFEAIGLGHKVSIVERGKFGGTCTNRGCIPTKFLLAAAALEIERTGAAATAEAWAKIQARKRALVDGLSRKIENDLAAAGVTLHRGVGKLDRDKKVIVSAEGKVDAVLDADATLVATGSFPSRLPIIPVDAPWSLSSDEALELSRVPASMVIIGSGFIGTELAYLFSLLGARVSLLEITPHILPGEDEDAAAVVHRDLERRGVVITTSASIVSVVKEGGEVAVGTAEGLFARGETVLVSVGRERNTLGLDLEKSGLHPGPQGALAVNDRMRTVVEGIYAAGDVTPNPMLAHVAEAQGVVAVRAMTGRDEIFEADSIPWAVFTSPEIGSVGLTESLARRRGIDYRLGKSPFTANIKARLDAGQDGFVKLLAEPKSGVILGGTIVGKRAADMIHVIALAVRCRLTAAQLSRALFIHPTLSESIKDAAAQAGGNS